MSLLVVVIALLLNQANISPCTHAQKLDSHDVPIHPLGRLQPKDILTGSDVLPINPLERTQPENIDDCDEELQKPTTRDLNERRLRRRLGGTIDERLLSVTEPAHLTNGPIVERVSLRSVTTAGKDFLRHVIRNETIPKLGKVSVSMERFLMKWLIHKSDCPVERTWKDLGFCYWPRWLSVSKLNSNSNSKRFASMHVHAWCVLKLGPAQLCAF